MQIVCTTTDSAEKVLTLFWQAQLRLPRDFTIHTAVQIAPPITFTLLTGIPTVLLEQIRTLPDTSIVR